MLNTEQVIGFASLLLAAGSETTTNLIGNGLLALLREGGVNLDAVTELPDAPTGTALIAVAPDGDNQIVVAPGANARLTSEFVTTPQTDAVICQLEVPAETVADVAGSYDGFFCVNLAPAKQIDVSILQRADLVVVNETESAWYGETLSACHGMIATTRGSGLATLERDDPLFRAPTLDALYHQHLARGCGGSFTHWLHPEFVNEESLPSRNGDEPLPCG